MEQLSDWEDFEALFRLAEIPVIKKWNLVNGYWPNDYWVRKKLNPDGSRLESENVMISPWYLVKTEWGMLVIGWRKRVISISWDDTELKIPKEDHLTKNEVTKWSEGIHAWDKEKALQYLIALRKRFEDLGRRSSEGRAADL